MWVDKDYRRYYENISILNQPTHQLLLGNKLINQLKSLNKRVQYWLRFYKQFIMAC